VTNVVMLSPGYPMEMAYFTRGLAAVGATVRRSASAVDRKGDGTVTGCSCPRNSMEAGPP